MYRALWRRVWMAEVLTAVDKSPLHSSNKAPSPPSMRGLPSRSLRTTPQRLPSTGAGDEAGSSTG